MPGLAGVAERLAQLGGAGGQQHHGLIYTAPGGGGADAEPGGQLGERLAFAQIGQDQQGLPASVELAPA